MTKTRRAAAAAGSLLIGMLVAFVFVFMLYRISLPSTPFIYVAF